MMDFINILRFGGRSVGASQVHKGSGGRDSTIQGGGGKGESVSGGGSMFGAGGWGGYMSLVSTDYGELEDKVKWGRKIANKLDTPLATDPPGTLETTYGNLIGGLFKGLGRSLGIPASQGNPQADRTEWNQKAATQAKNAVDADRKKSEEAIGDDLMRHIRWQVWDDAVREKQARNEEDKKKEPGDYPLPQDDGGGTVAYRDPDADPSPSTNASAFISPQQIEAKLMQNRMPVNPNRGPGSRVDLSSPPPHKRAGSLDPTIAYIDSDLDTGSISGSGTGAHILIGGGFTDPTRPEVAPQPPRGPSTG
jgi:hypothetical protein